MTRSTELTLYKTGLTMLVISPVLWYLYHYFQFDKLPCVLRTVTGLYCPGCGGTRAVDAFLHGHWIQSFRYHPFVPYFGILYLWFMSSNTIQILSRGKIAIGMKYRPVYLYIGLAIILINWILKLFFFQPFPYL